jgi:hypothetical protein
MGQLIFGLVMIAIGATMYVFTPDFEKWADGVTERRKARKAAKASTTAG